MKNIERSQGRLVLHFFYKPKIVKGRDCGFALRHYIYYQNKPRELVSEELLPTTNLRSAKTLLRRKDAELRKQDAAAIKRQNEAQAASVAMTESQLRCLSKAYPLTVAILKKPDTAPAGAAFTAYQRETLALSGTLVGTLDKDAFLKTAKVLTKASRRKNPAINAVAFELVAGWCLRGYDRMNPKQRLEALKHISIIGNVTPDAVRKICDRLKLPAVRKRGAPRKPPSGK